MAVTLVGSRDLRLYYRGEIRTDDLRALAVEGTVVEPGEWGRLMNGGARVTRQVTVMKPVTEIGKFASWISPPPCPSG